MIVSLPASPWFYRCLNAVLLLLVAWLAAGFLWQLFAPRPLPPVAAPAQVAVRAPTLDMSPLNGLFGNTASGELQPSTLTFKLRGVIATASPAAAVFDRPGQPALAVKTGDEIDAGVRLLEVAADHVVVDNRGRRERVELDAKPAAEGLLPADSAPAPGPAGLITAVANPVSAPPSLPPPRTESRGADEINLSRQALVNGMQSLNVADWAHGLSDAGGAGIKVDNAALQPLAGPLGLQSGDVLRSVNGAAMNRTGDISALYSAFSRAPHVTVEILRNGSPVSLRYRIESHSTP